MRCMTKNSQNKVMDWTLGSKVEGGDGTQVLGPLVLNQTPPPICMHITIIQLGS